MILTSDYQNGIISHIKSVTLTFDDSGEIILHNITDYDMEFNKIMPSIVELTHCYIDKDIIQKYTKNINIKHLYITMEIYDIITNESRISFLDIPCDMKIVSLKYKGDMNNVSDCKITLEGFCG